MSFSDPIVGGEGDLVRSHIRSPDYVTGVSGWSINRDGSAEFNNVTIRLDLTTGSIVVGPDTGPQIVIRISGGIGLIQLPTNQSFEATPPEIRSDYVDGATDYIFLQLSSGFTGGNGSDSTLKLYSGDATVLGEDPEGVIQTSGPNGTTFLHVFEQEIYLDTPQTTLAGELYVADDSISGNNPERIVKGEIGTGSTNTTIGAVDTEITNSAIASVQLENGVAYCVDVQIQVFANAGVAAAGTQGIQWKLWDGAVGTTQLGPTIQKYAEGATNNASTEKFSFLFEYAGTTGAKTIRLSAIHVEGAESMRAGYNTQYFMLVRRLGDPANILNL